MRETSVANDERERRAFLDVPHTANLERSQEFARLVLGLVELCEAARRAPTTTNS